jgi:imidazolonepropionase-like amidohydrolase
MKPLPYILLIITLYLLPSCQQALEYDLAITGVDVFDAEQGIVLRNKTILINADLVAGIVPASQVVKARQEIKGKGRLVTPGFIDTHIHLTDLYGDYAQAPEYLEEDSLVHYRLKLSRTYLEHGITTLRVAGQPEKWIAPTLAWQQNPSPEFPDLFISGGALISDEERTPYINHVEVESPEAMQQKIQAYHEMGIRHLKLYWRLRYPELKAALQQAKALDMHVTGHIDQNVATIDSTLNLGLKHYEHILTLGTSAATENKDYHAIMQQYASHYPGQRKATFFAYTMELFQYIEQDPALRQRLDQLIDQMTARKATLSTTIHLFAEKFGKSYFVIPALTAEDDASGFTQEQVERGQKGFALLMACAKKAHERGVKLTIGTDSRDGGKAALSEMLLLSEAGFSIADILQIATLNGAKAIGMEQTYGSVQVGKKANLVIFEKSPFDDYRNFLSEKTVIKDGVVYTAHK